MCIKRIKDNKEFFDQAIQEVYFLNYINQHGNPNEFNFLKLLDCFYLNVSSQAPPVHRDRGLGRRPVQRRRP